MKVLIACEFSGIVREAFRAKGHDAWSCDITPALDDSPYHLNCDVLTVLDKGWDLMIAHPDCTFITNAGVRHLHIHVDSRKGNRAKIFGPARWIEMEKACEFFNKLKAAPIEKIALENPIPHRYARELIGKYDQLVQPWQFGHGEVKATCIWRKNLPKLEPTDIVDGRYARCHLQSPGMKNGLTRAQRRSITYTGIAAAMADQWGRL